MKVDGIELSASEVTVVGMTITNALHMMVPYSADLNNPETRWSMSIVDRPEVLELVLRERIIFLVRMLRKLE